MKAKANVPAEVNTVEMASNIVSAVLYVETIKKIVNNFDAINSFYD